MTIPDAEFHRAIGEAAGLPIALRQEALRRLRAGWMPTGTFTLTQAAASKALSIGWVILTAHKAGITLPPVAEMWPATARPDRDLRARMQRAAMTVDEPLASHLRAIGVRNGRPCVKGSPVGQLRVTL